MHEVKGAKLNVMKDVYVPAEDTLLAAELLTRTINGKNLKVAEIGTGTGALGIVAAMDNRVASVSMSDISEEALECAKENAALNGIADKCSFAKCNLFEKITGSFDIIIFNPPYLPDDNETKTGKNWWSGGKTGIETTKLFLEQAARHLDRNGTIIIVVSSFADKKGIEVFIEEQKLEITDSESTHIFFEDITALALKKKE